MTATKEQEHKALAKIQKIVAELGPDSYLAAAFEGCWEDARQNIENDWALSQKQRADAAEKKVAELEEKLRQEISEKQQIRDKAQELIKKEDEHKAEIAKIRAMLLPNRTRMAAIDFLKKEEQKDVKRQEELADIMADFAKTPHDIAFTSAAENYGQVKAHRDAAREIIRALRGLASGGEGEEE